MLPIYARCFATLSSSNLPQSVPGVSRKSTPSMLIHCFPRVTPGRSPVTAPARLHIALMTVDLPELGTPTTIALTDTFAPRSPKRSILSAAIFFSPETIAEQSPEVPTALTYGLFSAENFSHQGARSRPSTRSHLLNTYSTFFPAMSLSKRGLLEL